METAIARALIAGEAAEGSGVAVGVVDGHLDVRIEPGSASSD